MLDDNIPSVEEYLSVYDDFLQDKIGTDEKKKPEVMTYYQQLKNQFAKICEESFSNPLLQMEQLLRTDAQLLLLMEMLSNNFIEDFNGDNLVDMIMADKDYYYREITGNNKNSKKPHGLIYLSER